MRFLSAILLLSMSPAVLLAEDGESFGGASTQSGNKTSHQETLSNSATTRTYRDELLKTAEERAGEVAKESAKEATDPNVRNISNTAANADEKLAIGTSSTGKLGYVAEYPYNTALMDRLEKLYPFGSKTASDIKRQRDQLAQEMSSTATTLSTGGSSGGIKITDRGNVIYDSEGRVNNSATAIAQEYSIPPLPNPVRMVFLEKEDAESTPMWMSGLIVKNNLQKILYQYTKYFYPILDVFAIAILFVYTFHRVYQFSVAPRAIPRNFVMATFIFMASAVLITNGRWGLGFLRNVGIEVSQSFLSNMGEELASTTRNTDSDRISQYNASTLAGLLKAYELKYQKDAILNIGNSDLTASPKERGLIANSINRVMDLSARRQLFNDYCHHRIAIYDAYIDYIQKQLASNDKVDARTAATKEINQATTSMAAFLEKNKLLEDPTSLFSKENIDSFLASGEAAFKTIANTTIFASTELAPPVLGRNFIKTTILALAFCISWALVFIIDIAFILFLAIFPLRVANVKDVMDYKDPFKEIAYIVFIFFTMGIFRTIGVYLLFMGTNAIGAGGSLTDIIKDVTNTATGEIFAPQDQVYYFLGIGFTLAQCFAPFFLAKFLFPKTTVASVANSIYGSVTGAMAAGVATVGAAGALVASVFGTPAAGGAVAAGTSGTAKTAKNVRPKA